MASVSGFVGSAIQVAEATSSGGFQGIISVYGAAVANFDAQLAAAISGTMAEFDAKLCVEIEATQVSPSAVIVTPTAVDASGLPPYTVAFSGVGTASGAKDIVQHTWFFPDIGAFAVSGGDNVSYTFENSGVYLVTYRVTDSDGFVGFDSVQVFTHSGIAIDLPELQVSGVPSTGNALLSVDFVASGGGTIQGQSGYMWSFGHGLFSKRQVQSGVPYNTPGHYLPSCSLWDDRGFIVSDSIEIGVNN